VFDKQQRPDGSIRQNTFVDGTPHWDGTQQDEVAFPIVLAWQLHRDDAQTYAQHVKLAADWLVRTGPQTDMDRWENQSGWSPGTIASEIAGLICAADLARKAGDDASAATYEATADQWQKSRELDGHHQRPVLRQALLPAPDQGRQPERRQHVLDRGQRAERGR
jgi:glucoamylase